MWVDPFSEFFNIYNNNQEWMDLKLKDMCLQKYSHISLKILQSEVEQLASIAVENESQNLSSYLK